MTFKPWTFFLVAVAGWMNRQQQDAISYLRVENQVLREKLGPKRIILNDNQKRRLAAAAMKLGRDLLRQFGTLFSPDTITDRKFDFAATPRAGGRLCRGAGGFRPGCPSTKASGGRSTGGGRPGRPSSAGGTHVGPRAETARCPQIPQAHESLGDEILILPAGQRVKPAQEVCLRGPRHHSHPANAWCSKDWKR
jgi:hypothetical protein